jgi:DNA-binding IclR family transcriptional regulator
VPGSVQSVERAAAILRLLAEDDEPIGLSQIASALGLAKGTVHGIVRTLEEVGFVDQVYANGPYRVATEVFRLGWTKLDPNELRSKALNWTDALAARSGESARVAAFRGGRAEVAHHVFRADGGTQVLVTGSVVPLHASALGKVLLAFDPGAARSVVNQDLPALTSRTITGKVVLQRELAVIRDLGWAGSVGEVDQGVAGIAAPIRDRGGYVVAVVGIEGSIDRICDEKLRPRPALITQVVRAGRAISRELGHGRDR